MPVNNDGSKINILIVDDEINIAADLEKRLLKMGRSVCGKVDDGESALSMVEKFNPDLVIMGIVLKGKRDGIEIGETIRAKWNIPVIFLIAQADIDRIASAKLAYPFGYLLKPYRNKDLRVTVEMALYAARIERERALANEALQKSHERRQSFFNQSYEAIYCIEFDEPIDTSLPVEEQIDAIYDRAFIGECNPAMDGFCLLDEQGRFLEVNEAYCDMTRYTEEELLLMTAADLDAGSGPHSLIAYIQDGAPGRKKRFETSTRRKDGGILDVEVSIQHSTLDGGCFFAFFRDITDKKTRGDESRFRAMVLDQIKDHVTITDLNGVITYVNQIQTVNLGRPRDAFIGKKIDVFGEDPSRGSTQNEILEMTLQNGSWRGEVINYAADGSELIMDFRTQVVFNEHGRPTALCGISTDITEQRRKENVLKENEARNQAVISALPDILFVIDADYYFLECHANNSNFLLHPPDEIVGRRVDEVLPPELASLTEQYIDSALSTGEIQYYRYQVKIDDEDLEFEARMVVSGVRRILVIVRDMTELVRSEAALRESETKYRQLFNHAPAGIFEINFVENRITSINDLACQYIGYTEKEILAMDPMDLLSEQSKSLFAERLLKVAQGESITDNVEYEIVAKSGEVIWAILALNFQYEGDRLIGASVVAHNITDRKLAEIQLQESKKEAEAYRNDLELFSRLTPLGMIVFDNEFKIVSWNPGAEGIFGYTAEEAVGRNAFEILVPDYEHNSVKNIFLLTEPEITVNINDNLTKDGRIITVQWFNSPRLDADGNLTGLITACQDFTERRQAEEALKKSEDRFRALTEKSPLGISLVDPEGRFEYINPAFTSIFGYSLLDFSAWTHWLELAFSDQRSRNMLNLIIENDSKGRPVSDIDQRVLEVRCKDGQTKIIMFRSAAASSHGRIILYEDITKSRQAEEERRRLEQNYETLFREMLDGFALHEIICDERGAPVDYRFLALNPAFERITGFSAEQITGRSAKEIIPGIEPYWIEIYGHVALTGKPVFFENYSRKFDKYFEVTAYQPAPNQFACIFADITDRKQAEDALRQSEEKYSKAFLTSPYAITINRIHDGKFLEVNEAFESITGYSKAEALNNSSIASRIWPNEQDRKGMVKDLLEGRHVLSREYKMKKKNGETVHALFSAQIIRLNNENLILSSTSDITEKKLMEAERNKLQNQLQQAQKMEAVGTLAGGVSHDFNNLLQAINGYTQLLLMDKSENDPDYPSLKAIWEAGSRASDLVRQLLLFSRKADSRKKPTQLDREVDPAVKLLERTIPKMVEIKVIIGGRLWMIMADPVQIEQLILNLGGNAADAMPEGGRLTIEIENITTDDLHAAHEMDIPPGRYVLLTVSDTGHGMDEETREKIFEPFFTTKEFGKGTGLGLASVYGIVKSHGGYINCCSEAGLGTTFKVYFPAVDQKESNDSSVESIKPPPRGHETVMLVDDETAIRDICSQTLIKFGYTVLTATSGEEALELFSNREKWFGDNLQGLFSGR